MKNDFYVYIYYRLDGLPCYVGKGSGFRWKRHPTAKNSNAHLQSLIRLAGGDLPRRKVVENLTEAEAFAWEIALIAEIGREANGGPLVNLTDGGEGSAGAKMTSQWRAHRSAMAKKAWSDPAHKEKHAKAMQGNRNKKGKPNSDLWRQLTTERLKGNTHTLGLIHTDEARAKMSAAHKGKQFTEAHKKALSEAMRASHAARKTRADLKREAAE